MEIKFPTKKIAIKIFPGDFCPIIDEQHCMDLPSLSVPSIAKGE